LNFPSEVHQGVHFSALQVSSFELYLTGLRPGLSPKILKYFQARMGELYTEFFPQVIHL
jgi:tRNA A37 threonylcarbamoyladenosine modification protein TsaB